MRIILKYLGYFSAVAGSFTIIYALGVFFANIQSDIKTVVNTLTEIKAEQEDQSKKIKNIEYEVISIGETQKSQMAFDHAIDRSYSDHLKKSKELIDEYLKYLEMQKEEEKKKLSSQIQIQLRSESLR
jgi:septal ring factor EnvC (AmiA/AmiB activator)